MDFSYFRGKKILITGGTGTVGQALAKQLLELEIDTIRIFSRNENKQVKMQEIFSDDRLHFFVGDVRDYPRLVRALEDVDVVFHTAALKHVNVIEYNPFEAIKTNVIGSQNVIDTSIDQNVEKVVGISTDKAVSPISTYGATKLLMERIFVTANNFSHQERHRTRFLAARFGNVLGSSGSVVPTFLKQIQTNDQITITDPQMTRFTMTPKEAVTFILESTVLAKGSEIFIPKLRAYKIEDLAKALKEIKPYSSQKKIPIRPGEKLNEILFSQDELPYVWELNDKYVIFPTVTEFIFPPPTESQIQKWYPGIKKVTAMQSYTSDLVKKVSREELVVQISDLGHSELIDL